MAVEIPLWLKGQITGYTIVDDDDALIARRHRWRLFKGLSGKLYAFRNEGSSISGRRRTIFLHRVLLGLPPVRNGIEVDHIDGDGLNNRRRNLRKVTHAQNQQNKLLYRNNQSGYRGVYWRAKKAKWAAEARIGGTKSFLGYFDDVHEAGRVVSEWRAQHMPFAVEAA